MTNLANIDQFAAFAGAIAISVATRKALRKNTGPVGGVESSGRVYNTSPAAGPPAAAPGYPVATQYPISSQSGGQVITMTYPAPQQAGQPVTYPVPGVGQPAGAYPPPAAGGPYQQSPAGAYPAPPPGQMAAGPYYPGQSQAPSCVPQPYPDVNAPPMQASTGLPEKPGIPGEVPTPGAPQDAYEKPPPYAP